MYPHDTKCAELEWMARLNVYGVVLLEKRQ